MCINFEKGQLQARPLGHQTIVGHEKEIWSIISNCHKPSLVSLKGSHVVVLNAFSESADLPGRDLSFFVFFFC